MHRGYIGAGTIRTANHQSTPKGHRTFTHPVTPKASKIESDAPEPMMEENSNDL